MKKSVCVTVSLLLCLFSAIFLYGGESLENLDFPRRWQVFLPVSREYNPSAAELKHIPSELNGVKAQSLDLIDGYMDLCKPFGGVREGNTAWLFAQLNAPERGEYTMGCGADWWFSCYLNGKEIYSTLNSGNDIHPPAPDNHKFTLKLKKGVNVIAVKFVSGSGSSILAMGGNKKFASGKLGKLTLDKLNDFRDRGIPTRVPVTVAPTLQTMKVPDGYVIILTGIST